jgi:glycosyltransferase involved in cell wall biosynthesis
MAISDPLTLSSRAERTAPAVAETVHRLSLHSSEFAAHPSRPLNVVFAIHTPRDAATAVYKNTCQRANYLERLGHRCTILTPDDFPTLHRFGARVQPLLYPIALSRWLATTGKNTDIALFHSYSGWATSLVQNHLRAFTRLKTAILFHGLEPLYYARLEKEIRLSWRYRLLHGKLMLSLLRSSSHAADMLLCLNSEEACYLLSNQWGTRNRVHVLSNPAPDSFFIERHHRPHAAQLLFVGQWLPMKGVHYLAQAFTRLFERHPDLHLCCAGTLAPEAHVLALFPDHVRPNVTVHPRVTEDELLGLHRQADIFVLPTLSEGFSLALAEAMASGLPIVTTPVGAAPDILYDRTSALLVPSRDAEALTDSIASLLDDVVLRDRLGNCAQVAAQRLRPEFAGRDFGVCFQLLVSIAKSGDNGLQLSQATSKGS